MSVMSPVYLVALTLLLCPASGEEGRGGGGGGEEGCDQFQAVTCVLSEDNIVGFSRENVTQSCQDQCISSPGCGNFTHYEDQCYLLASCQIQDQCQDCVSGPTQPPFSSCAWPPCPSTPPPTTTTTTSTAGWCEEYLVGLQCDLDEQNVLETLHSPSIGACQVRSQLSMSASHDNMSKCQEIW